MPTQSWIKLAALLIAVILFVALVEAWRVDRRDRDQLAAELAATKQLLAAAAARQHDRDAQLNQTLAALAAEKRTIVPLVLQIPPATSGASAASDSKPASPQAIIPAEDLKPLYDFTLDCKACQARLATVQSDLTDEKTKTSALTKERDQAVQMARGGSVWRRVGRAAKWFLIGAAAGAIAAKTAH